MDTQIDQEKKRLTVDDPIDTDTISKLTALQDARLRIGDRLLELELERVRLIRSATSVATERQKLFERVLIERGLSPNQPVSIDQGTGQLKVLSQSEAETIMTGQQAASPAAANG